MNYTQLFNTIKAYCENDFAATAFTGTNNTSTVVVVSSDQINTFIQQTEQRLFSIVQPPMLRKNVTGALTIGNKYLNLPLDFLSVYSLAVYTNSSAGLNSPQAFLLNKDVNYLREAYPDPLESGIPQYYALFGPNEGVNVNLTYNQTTLIVAPTPDDSYAVELHYFHYPESIVTAGESWLGDYFDSVLLYGSLLEAITFMKGEQDLIALYTQRYMEALELYKQLGDGKDRGDAYRNGQVRVPVN
jgi:hypothetical protein